MKKSISVLAIALMASCLSLSAQNRINGAPESRTKQVGQHEKMIAKDLNLTEDQKAKLKALHREFAVKDSVVREQFKKQREGIQAERRAALANILTPEQMAQMDKAKEAKGPKNNRERQFAPRNGRNGTPDQFASREGQPREMNVGRGRNMKAAGERPMAYAQPKFGGKDAKAFQKKAKNLRMVAMVNPKERIEKQVEHLTKVLDLTPEQASKIKDIQLKHSKKEIARYEKIQKKHHGNMDEIKAVLTPEQVSKLEKLKEKAPEFRRGNAPIGGMEHGMMNGRI